MTSNLCSFDGLCDKSVKIGHGLRECTITAKCNYRGRRQINLHGLIGNRRLSSAEYAELRAGSETRCGF